MYKLYTDAKTGKQFALVKTDVREAIQVWTNLTGKSTFNTLAARHGVARALIQDNMARLT